MKNINTESCQYMRVNGGRLVRFDSSFPTQENLESGKVKVRYYLTKDLESLDNEFKDNRNVVSVDLSKMNTSYLTNIDNAFNGCKFIESINLGNTDSTKEGFTKKDAFANIEHDVDITGKDDDLVNSAIQESNYVKVTSIELNETSVELYLNRTIQLEATVTPENASDKTVTWESSYTTVATVDNGLVTAYTIGDVLITAKAGDYEATCSVVVPEPVYNVVNPLEVSIDAYGEVQVSGSYRIDDWDEIDLTLDNVEFYSNEETSDVVEVTLNKTPNVKIYYAKFVVDNHELGVIRVEQPITEFVEVSNAQELQEAMNSVEDTRTIKIMEDILVESTLTYTLDIEKTIDLNNHTITNSNNLEDTYSGENFTDLFAIKNGILNLVGQGTLMTASRTGSPIWATKDGKGNHGTVNLSGEIAFICPNGIAKGKGWSLIFADSDADINISDGYFIVKDGVDEGNYGYMLNCKDKVESYITLTGGYYLEWDPRLHDAIRLRPEYPEVIIADGYKVEKLENTTFFEYTGTWYHVVEMTDEEKIKEASTVLVNNVEEFNSAISNESVKTIKLNANIGLSSTLVFSNVTKTIDLNGYVITNTNLEYETNEDGSTITTDVDGLTVKAGSNVTVIDTYPTKSGMIRTISGGGSPIYANGGNVVLNEAVYESLEGLDAGNGFSLIFANSTGTVEINNGYFIVNGNPDESKYQYILNCKDPDLNAVITVKGGYFYNWNPENHDNNGHEEIIIPSGYSVEKLENTTLYGKTGTWYHVVESDEELSE